MSQGSQNNEPNSGVGGKVALALAIIGLFTAFFSNGGVQLLSNLQKPQPREVSSQTPTILPSSSSTSIPAPNPSVSTLALPTQSSSPTVLKEETATEVTVENIGFRLNECKRASETVLCEFVMTSQNGDQKLRIFSSTFGSAESKIIDHQGNQYIAESIEISGYKPGAMASQKLVQDIPVKAFLKFNTVSAQVSQLALVDISIRTKNLQTDSVKFRNVSILNQ